MAKRKNKSNPVKVFLPTLFGTAGLCAIVWLLLRGNDVALFNPKGAIAHAQYRLMITAVLIMLEIAIPVLFFLYYFAWKYRESNEKATYDPVTVRGRPLSFAIWGFPAITMMLLVVLLIPATHELEPQKAIAAEGKSTMTVQVVALQWKWLFIYPEQKIATVNYAQIPVDQPVEFVLTADDTPMSSFWIPHLGGMLYAMTGHINRLNLVADTMGDYPGSAAEINGAGMAGMRFDTHIGTQAEFDAWVQKTRASSAPLDAAEYAKLLKPSENDKAAYFSNPDPKLYGTILAKYADSHQHNSSGAYE